jgi:hypothetical protein
VGCWPHCHSFTLEALNRRCKAATKKPPKRPWCWEGMGLRSHRFRMVSPSKCLKQCSWDWFRRPKNGRQYFAQDYVNPWFPPWIVIFYSNQASTPPTINQLSCIDWIPLFMVDSPLFDGNFIKQVKFWVLRGCSPCTSPCHHACSQLCAMGAVGESHNYSSHRFSHLNSDVYSLWP